MKEGWLTNDGLPAFLFYLRHDYDVALLNASCFKESIMG